MNWLPQSASTFAPGVDLILWLVTIISVLSCVLIGFLLVYFCVKYKRKSDNDQTPAITHDSFLETLWTVIPTILCIVIFLYGYIYYDEYTTTPKNAVEINVTAKQWIWSFDYSNGKKTLNELYVPVNQPIRLVMQSDDVLHSFFVPADAGLRDSATSRVLGDLYKRQLFDVGRRIWPCLGLSIIQIIRCIRSTKSRYRWSTYH